LFEARAERPILFMSSVVAMELFAGCRTKPHRSAVAAFPKPFEKAGRVIEPDQGSFVEAGVVLARLGGEGLAKTHVRLMSNDVLIAVSAARAGITVVTQNVRDFTRIARWAPIHWQAPE
jgi:predicted nucleic acid-binding protein